jgi:8-oxo-dGTP diphosphatase
MNETTLIPAVSVALMRGQTVLMVKRAHEPARGQWAFAGGRVEPGETLEQAARRELAEETGMSAGALRQLTEMRLGRFHLTVFAGEALPGEPKASDDAEEAGFFGYAELMAINATESTKHCAALLFDAV